MGPERPGWPSERGRWRRSLFSPCCLGWPRSCSECHLPTDYCLGLGLSCAMLCYAMSPCDGIKIMRGRRCDVIWSCPVSGKGASFLQLYLIVLSIHALLLLFLGLPQAKPSSFPYNGKETRPTARRGRVGMIRRSGLIVVGYLRCLASVHLVRTVCMSLQTDH